MPICWTGVGLDEIILVPVIEKKKKREHISFSETNGTKCSQNYSLIVFITCDLETISNTQRGEQLNRGAAQTIHCSYQFRFVFTDVGEHV